MAYDLSSRATRDPLITTTVIAVFAVLTTAIRLKARRMRKMRFTLDDYLMFATLVRLPMPLIINFFIDVVQLLEIASIGLLYSGNTPSFDESPMLTPIAVINGGEGRPIDEVNPADIPKLFKISLAFQVLYGFVLCFLKISIICFYLRIFGGSRTFQNCAYSIIGIAIAWAIAVELSVFLLCRPLAYNWDHSLNGTCRGRNKAYISAGGVNVATDFMVMGLPVPYVWNLHLAWRRKVGVCIMFSLGTVVTVISMIRIKFLVSIDFANPTQTLFPAGYWTSLEATIGIICANLPMVRMYLVSVAPSIFGTTNARTSANTTAPTRIRNISRPDAFELIEDCTNRFAENDVEVAKPGAQGAIVSERKDGSYK
ncbi:hypothetical protein DL95DRAFT_480514 [Leptodontidium sp. 2 PMI_412]|nr:hypothetical protein DL95DRAFT_480514 [Leptodontidium sp. 2 PMI_412]